MPYWPECGLPAAPYNQWPADQFHEGVETLMVSEMVDGELIIHHPSTEEAADIVHRVILTEYMQAGNA